MVNVSEKPVTKRCATASGRIYLTPETFALISSPSSSPTPNATTETESQTPANVRPKNTHFNSKGDVLTTAQLAGIMAAKATPSLIPLCHSLPLSHVKVDFTLSDSRGEEKEKERTKRPSVGCRVTVECEGKTGVEMEALTGVSVALLTVWDMVKGVDGAGRRLEVGASLSFSLSLSLSLFLSAWC
jgi:cyclic pyranopterin phosphate synthase